jgi:hypothetical protein
VGHHGNVWDVIAINVGDGQHPRCIAGGYAGRAVGGAIP